MTLTRHKARPNFQEDRRSRRKSPASSRVPNLVPLGLKNETLPLELPPRPTPDVSYFRSKSPSYLILSYLQESKFFTKEESRLHINTRSEWEKFWYPLCSVFFCWEWSLLLPSVFYFLKDIIVHCWVFSFPPSLSLSLMLKQMMYLASCNSSAYNCFSWLWT